MFKINEYLLSCSANIVIIDKIFTLDFLQSIFIALIQIVITVLVRFVFDYFKSLKK